MGYVFSYKFVGCCHATIGSYKLQLVESELPFVEDRVQTDRVIILSIPYPNVNP